MLKEQLNLTAAIVRTFDFAGIGEFVSKLLDFGIRHVVVVVPKEQDNGVTAPLLATFDSTRVHLIERSFEKGGQAWSAMLNDGLDYIETSLGEDFIDYVLMVSNTVRLEPKHLARLYQDLRLPSAMVAGLKFQGVRESGETVDLGTAYNGHYRNTLAVYKREAFLAHHLLRRFLEDFDGQGGMEDLAWKRILEHVTNLRCVENPYLPESLWVPLLVHQHRTAEEQTEYEANMEKGIDAVEAYIADLRSRLG